MRRLYAWEYAGKYKSKYFINWQIFESKFISHVTGILISIELKKVTKSSVKVHPEELSTGKVLLIFHKIKNIFVKKCSRTLSRVHTFQIPIPSYRGRPLRSAFLKMTRTIWECTPKIVKDHMGVHFQKRKGPHRSALQNAKGSIWECTPKKDRDHMGVHSFLIGTKWECTRNF